MKYSARSFHASTFHPASMTYAGTSGMFSMRNRTAEDTAVDGPVACGAVSPARWNR